MSIRFDQVHKAFGSKKVLDGVSFEAGKGEVLFILGKSGMGKSVTLKHIIGVLEPDQGRIFVDQFEVSALFTSQNRHLLPKVRQRCGMVFQHPPCSIPLAISTISHSGSERPSMPRKSGAPCLKRRSTGSFVKNWPWSTSIPRFSACFRTRFLMGFKNGSPWHERWHRNPTTSCSMNRLQDSIR